MRLIRLSSENPISRKVVLLAPRGQIACLRARIALISQTVHFLFAITLVAVSSPRIVNCLSPSGRAQPPSVPVLHVVDDEELEITSRHKTSSLVVCVHPSSICLPTRVLFTNDLELDFIHLAV
jgi:hypothetical protein